MSAEVIDLPARLQAENTKLKRMLEVQQQINAAAIEVSLYGATVSRLQALDTALKEAEEELLSVGNL